MKKTINLLILLIIIMLVSCNGESADKLLLGTWEGTMYVPKNEAAKMSAEPMPEGFGMELSAVVQATYHRGGKFNGEMEYTLRLIAPGQEVPLRFFVREAGTWNIHGDTLVETSTDSNVLPLDDLTKSVVKQSPELLTMITPIKGDSSSTKIAHITKSIAEFELLEPPFIKITLRKIDNT